MLAANKHRGPCFAAHPPTHMQHAIMKQRNNCNNWFGTKARLQKGTDPRKEYGRNRQLWGERGSSRSSRKRRSIPPPRSNATLSPTTKVMSLPNPKERQRHILMRIKREEEEDRIATIETYQMRLNRHVRVAIQIHRMDLDSKVGRDPRKYVDSYSTAICSWEMIDWKTEPKFPRSAATRQWRIANRLQNKSIQLEIEHEIEEIKLNCNRVSDPPGGITKSRPRWQMIEMNQIDSGFSAFQWIREERTKSDVSVRHHGNPSPLISQQVWSRTAHTHAIKSLLFSIMSIYLWNCWLFRLIMEN